MKLALALLVLAAPLAVAPAATARRAATDVPVAVRVAVRAADLAITGIFTIELEFTALEDVAAAYAVRIAVCSGQRPILLRDHAPEPPTRQWRRGKAERYAIPMSFPLDPELRGGELLDVRVGFVDAATAAVLPPRDPPSGSDGLADAAELEAPVFLPIAAAEQVDGLIATAAEFRSAGRKAEAWDVLELGIRRAETDPLKRRLREALLALGALAPRPLSIVEQSIVRQRIEDERARYLRLVAGSMHDRKRFHGARAILESVGGSLEEQAGAAVLGALADAERVAHDVHDLEQQLLDHVPDEDSAAADKALAELELGEKLFDRAEAFAKAKRFGAARKLLRELRRADSQALVDRVKLRLPEVEARYLADMPEDQRAEVAAALGHPCFPRTTVRASHRFLFIGPKLLVESIPDDSIHRFDLAYVFLTDLFGRVPNPEGDRVTVYFKELWDFGGGIGGGKIIDIGNARPDQKGVRVDNGLLYHELTHCIDDTRPIFEGFREGLANVGAAYAFEALGQDSDALHGFASNLEAFRTDYLERDLEYWKIPNYGPSAGFFLHFIEQYAKTKEGHDWSGLRRFFREYRAAPVRDGREPFVARALAHYLVRAFGPPAFDDLIAFRFPLHPSDRDAVALELDAFAEGSIADLDEQLAPERFPNAQIPRDLLARELLQLAGSGDRGEAIQFGRERLGLIYDWRVIGPFSRDGADPGACIFPPEYEIDFSKEYPVRLNLAVWRRPEEHPPVILETSGWVRIEYPYQDDTATYALCHVSAAAAVRAVAHVRADDDVTLFVNGTRAGDYRGRGWNDSTQFQWRGPVRELPDAMRFPIELTPGRNRILVKVRNRGGPAGFALALSGSDGTPIEGLAVDTAPPDPAGASADAAKSFVRAFRYEGSSRDVSARFDLAVGKWKQHKNQLIGDSTDRRVEWRKYTVRPGFPKDSPSNLLWLKSKATEGIGEFALELGVAASGRGAPKLLVTFQGEGGSDALSGWNLIVQPWGARVTASLERYDQLVYESGPRDLAPEELRELALTYAAGRLSVALGDVVLFDGVPIRAIPQRHRIGIATWGPEVGIEHVELKAPPRR